MHPSTNFFSQLIDSGTNLEREDKQQLIAKKRYVALRGKMIIWVDLSYHKLFILKLWSFEISTNFFVAVLQVLNLT